MAQPFLSESELVSDLLDWTSTPHGLVTYVQDTSMQNLFKLAAFPTFYFLVSRIVGAEGSMLAHIGIVGSEFASGAPFAAASVALVGSAVAQREVWHVIGDEKTGAIHFSGAGGLSGGSMPVVTSQDTSDPMGGFSWKSIMSLF
jgi:hypothetical protein